MGQNELRKALTDILWELTPQKKLAQGCTKAMMRVIAEHKRREAFLF